MNYEASIPNLSSSHVMDVHYANWRTEIIITTSGTRQQLYMLTGNRCRRQFSITNAKNELIGCSNTHSMSSRIDFETVSEDGVNRTFEMRNDKIVGGSPNYTSQAFDGQVMTWKNKAMSSKIVYTLIDGHGMALAKFESSPRSRVGRLEITDAVVGEDKFNEIAVTLLTLLERKLRAIQASYIAAVTA